ncbi:lamin tail domain-containing protein, partial [Streptosporangium algeriense]
MRASSRAISALAVLGAAAATVTALPPTPALAEPGTVVISQVYGAGGNSGAPLANDFVELFNRSSAPVPLDGWSVQYGSATGTGNFAANPVVPLSGTLEPGRYHLIQLAGGGTGAPLPTPDATGTANMSAASGKVVLVRSAQGLACNGGSAPCSPEQSALIADLVGYGTANYAEGTPAPTLSVTTAALRGDHGCADTDANGADLVSASPA